MTARTSMLSDNAPKDTKAKNQHKDVGEGWEPKDDETYKVEVARSIQQVKEESPMKRTTADAERKCRAIAQI